MKKKRKWNSRNYEKERKEFYKKQNGRCAICGKHQNTFARRLNLDHNHKTGVIRGLLCYRCNKFVVGRHTLESALKLVEYLKIEKWHWPYLRMSDGPEYACRHNVGHSNGVHGCDGCCSDPDFPGNKVKDEK